MINDYAGYCATAGENKLHRLAGKFTARNCRTAPASGVVRKAASVLVALTLLAGLSSTFMYSVRINQALDSIGTTKTTLQTLTARQQELAARRSQLESRKYIRIAAAKLGLFSPDDGQIRTLKSP